MGGCFFVKKVDLPPQNETKLNQTLLFILHFTYLGGGAYAPNAPPAYGRESSVAALQPSVCMCL